MFSAITTLLVSLSVVAAGFVLAWVRAVAALRHDPAALPTVVQALIYTRIIEVDVLTLTTMIIASVLGSWLGAGIVCRRSKRRVRIGMGIAPCMILVSLLGMNPKAAFPIMMCSCAFLIPAASMKFIREKECSLRAA